MNANTATKQATEIINFPIPEPEGLTNRQIDNRLRKLATLEAEKKRIDAEIKALKEEVIEGIFEMPEHHTTNFVIKYTVFDRTTVDSKRLKADFPEVYAEYSKTSKQSRFTYKEV